MILKEINCVEHEYMDICPSPDYRAFATALRFILEMFRFDIYYLYGHLNLSFSQSNVLRLIQLTNQIL